jgi:hypothetical protein
VTIELREPGLTRYAWRATAFDTHPVLSTLHAGEVGVV